MQRSALTALLAAAAFSPAAHAGLLFSDGDFTSYQLVSSNNTFVAGTTPNGIWRATANVLSTDGNPGAYLRNFANNTVSFYGIDVSGLTFTDTVTVSVDLNLLVQTNFNNFGVQIFGLTNGNAALANSIVRDSFNPVWTAPAGVTRLTSTPAALRAATGGTATTNGWVSRTDTFTVDYSLYDVILVAFYSNGSNAFPDGTAPGLRGLDNVVITSPAIPEPAALGLLAPVGLLALRRR